MVRNFLFILFIFTVSFAHAQDSIPEQDSIVPRTNDSLLLNDLWEYPPKNPLPVRKPVLQIQPIVIPPASLEMKVNYWKNWVSFGININQAAFSDSWQGGGVNSLALGTNFNYKTDYTIEKMNYVSEVALQYGKLKNKGQLERKTNDRIFWDNKFGYKLSKNWNFFGSLTFESQFDLGYSYLKNSDGSERSVVISKFMAPGYLTESLGLEYKPNKFFYLRFGTGTARQTFVLDRSIYNRAILDFKDFKNYGVDPGKRFRNELAFQLVSSFEKDIMQNINLKSRYSMFANYEKLNNIDHRLDVQVLAKVNKLINVSLNAVGLYDKDANSKIQASQALGLGLIYKFPR